MRIGNTKESENHAFVTVDEKGRGTSNAYSTGKNREMSDVVADIFRRGLCLPSDIKMTKGEQERVIEIVKRYFA